MARVCGRSVRRAMRTSRWSAPQATIAKPEDTATPATVEVHAAPQRSSMTPPGSKEKTKTVDATV